MTGKECVRHVIAWEPAPYVPLGFRVVDCDAVEHVIGRPACVRNKVEMRKAYWDGRRGEAIESLQKDTVEFSRKSDCCAVRQFHGGSGRVCMVAGLGLLMCAIASNVPAHRSLEGVCRGFVA